MNKYYDGTKLLNTKDLNGNTPEIFICSGNRTSGKTTYFSRYLVNRFLKHGEQFCLIYRYDYELDSISNKFFTDIQSLFFPDHTMAEKKREKGKYLELFIDDKLCGFAVCLNNPNVVKNNSHNFSRVKRMFMDEFQAMGNKYCKDEVKNFRSIHTSIARGQGKQSRYVPVILLSNFVTILNPYFTALGISARLQAGTKFMKGNGFVLELNVNESAAKSQEESLFNQAFGDDDFAKHEAQNIYLYDNYTFIEKPQGKSRYLATLIFKNCEYAIREFADAGIVYCDDKADKTYPFKISVTLDDHQINYVMLKKNDLFLTSLRFYFDHGCFRFKNLQSKDAVLTALTLY